MKFQPPRETPINKVETFAERVKKRIMETQANEEKLLKKLESEPLNARCSVVLQNELPPKEKDPRSFILPCIIGNTTVSNALADLGARISVIPFSMFKRLGLGNPKPTMVIEMADISLQSPKRIVVNVPVKIHKFIFLVDVVILDIIKDEKVPIILGRPMLATAHARIDIFRGKISLEVKKEQIIFNATLVTVSLVCVINDYDVIDDIGGPEDLEKLLMNDDINGDLGSFLHDNDLLPNFDNPEAVPLPPNRSSSNIWDPVEEFQDLENNMGIRIDNFMEIDDL
ncbi:retrovirus-related pol polyprotein from transposon TNT 1-94 [Tanacetum coccineum]